MSQRFWCQLDQSPRVDESGFFLERSTWIGNPNSRPPARLEDLDDRPCLVLLGEPGMGKSTDLQAARKQRELTADPSEVVIAHDLAEFGPGGLSIQQVFQGEAWDGWEHRKCSLRVELDSLDECRLAIPHVVNILKGQLSRLVRVDGLKFRITCRTAAWPQSLGEVLKEHYGDQIEFRQLAPLSRADATILARDWGVSNAEAFLDQITGRRLGPLAARPVTLRLLAKLARSGEPLPSSLAELYEKGLRELCKEPNRSRRDARRPVRLDPDRRYAVAARIAALMIFANKSAIRRDESESDRADGDISVAELASGSEVDALNGEFPVTEHDVQEVLDDTGLFDARGTDRLAWSHRTFAEFLASRYLIHRRFRDEQIKSLLLAPLPPAKVIPPLHETAAWLAGANPTVFQTLVAHDPVVLLESDVAIASPTARASLVEALLQTARAGNFDSVFANLQSRYRPLDHPDLATQLEPIFRDQTAQPDARRLAIDLARECQVAALQRSLADIALNRAESLPIREGAAYALTTSPDPTAKRRLRGLLETNLEEDTNDELRGFALTALWPDSLTVEEVFLFVTAPRRPNFGGHYRYFFLHEKLLQNLTPDDLPCALDWVILQDEIGNPSDYRHKLVQAILRKSWAHLDRDPVADRVVDIVWKWLDDHPLLWPLVDHPPDDILWADADKRRKFLQLLIDRLANGSDAITTPRSDNLIRSIRYHFVGGEDGEWLLGLLDRGGEPRRRAVLAQLILAWAESFIPRLLDALIEAAERHPELADALHPILGPIELQSEAAEAARRYYQRKLKLEEMGTKGFTLEPPLEQRFDILLTRSEAGSPDAWWQLSYELTLTPTSRHYGDPYPSDVTTLPGWAAASDATRIRIIAAAFDYLQVAHCKAREHNFTKDEGQLDDFAAFKALRLLEEQAPERFGTLGPEVWREWIPAIISYPILGNSHPVAVPRRYVMLAYEQAPDEVFDWLDRWLTRQCHQTQSASLDRHLWADLPITATHEMLLRRVRDEATSPRAMKDLLDELLSGNSPEARQHIEALLAQAIPQEPTSRERVLAAASSLLLHTPDAGWSILWPVIQSSPDFCHQFVRRLVSHLERIGMPPFLNKITEQEVADFYLWFEQHIPRYNRPMDHGAVAVVWDNTPQEIEWFREGVLRNLEHRGTPRSLIEIDRLAAALPDNWYVGHVRREAAKLVLERTWTPIRPADLLAMATSGQARFVAGGDQLLDIVRESLGRLQARLQGDTPSSFALWDERADKTFRPKGEERLSDWIKDHLDADLVHRGVIVNREVEIRSKALGRPGERTDIHVDAVLKAGRRDGVQRVKLIIEVKGCWNPGVMTAMRTQLVERYLKDDDCQHGLYVVGWYSRLRWDKSDNRYERSARPLDQLRSDLEAKGTELSVGSKRVEVVVLNCSLA